MRLNDKDLEYIAERLASYVYGKDNSLRHLVRGSKLSLFSQQKYKTQLTEARDKAQAVLDKVHSLLGKEQKCQK